MEPSSTPRPMPMNTGSICTCCSFCCTLLHHIGDRLDGVEPPYQIEDVTELQAGLAGRDQLDTGTG